MANKRKRRWGNWVVALVVVAAAVWGIAWYMKGRNSNAVQYQTAEITRGEVTQVVTATGTLNPVVNVQVGSQISGRIKKLYADFNSAVKEGQLIAEIDPSTYEANVQRAEADLSSARASLELAQVEARRATELYTNNLISSSEHDSAMASLHQSEASMQIRQAALDSAKVDLSRCMIYSPVDGTVISRSVDVGQTVAASMSAPELFMIASDLTKMQIDANVAEADVGGVEEGQDVEFTVDAFPYRTFYGKVTQVRNAPLTVQNVVSYDTVIEVNNADLKLKPGMTANVSIILEHRDNALRIPNGALRFRPPEDAIVLSETNEPAIAGMSGQNRTNEIAGAGGQGRRRGGPGGGGFGGRGGGQGGFVGRGGGQGGFGGRGGGQSGFGNRSGGNAARLSFATVYVLPGGTNELASANVELKAVRVRTGITDGIMTEVVSGLSENEVVVTGTTLPQAEIVSGAQNPFRGGRRGFRRF